jgi:hypothetical protein
VEVRVTDVVSALSGKIGKSLAVGALLPAVLFVALALHFVGPLLPTSWPLHDALSTLSDPETAINLALVTLVVTGFLYALNLSIIRLYEGYSWKESWLGRRRTENYQARFAAVDAFWRGGRTLVLDQRFETDPRYLSVMERWAKAGLALNKEFPGRADLVLPTKLGNVIRSFEDYPRRQYGMFAITLWPRLVAKIDATFAGTIDDAKALLDLAINSSLLAGILALALLVTGLVYPAALDQLSIWGIPGYLVWLLEVLALAGLSVMFYALSISRADAWGAAIKGAFDLYRWELLAQLGYEQLPRTRMEERVLWDAISSQIAYGDSARGPHPDYVAPIVASAEPEDIALEATRAGKRTDDDRPIIVISVRNVDPEQRKAMNLVVEDRLPDSVQYEWGSAAAGENPVRVCGSNPYRFGLGDLQPSEEVVLTYRVIPRENAENQPTAPEASSKSLSFEPEYP